VGGRYYEDRIKGHKKRKKSMYLAPGNRSGVICSLSLKGGLFWVLLQGGETFARKAQISLPAMFRAPISIIRTQQLNTDTLRV